MKRINKLKITKERGNGRSAPRHNSQNERKAANELTILMMVSLLGTVIAVTKRSRLHQKLVGAIPDEDARCSKKIHQRKDPRGLNWTAQDIVSKHRRQGVNENAQVEWNGDGVCGRQYPLVTREAKGRAPRYILRSRGWWAHGMWNSCGA